MHSAQKYSLKDYISLKITFCTFTKHTCQQGPAKQEGSRPATVCPMVQAIAAAAKEVQMVSTVGSVVESDKMSSGERNRGLHLVHLTFLQTIQFIY